MNVCTVDFDEFGSVDSDGSIAPWFCSTVVVTMVVTLVVTMVRLNSQV